MTMSTVRSRASGTQRVTNALNAGRTLPECCKPNSANNDTTTYPVANQTVVT